MTHRDFSRYISTDEDRLTVHRWVYGSTIVYGLLALLVIGDIAVRNHQTDPSHNAKTTGPIPMTIATNKIRTQ